MLRSPSCLQEFFDDGCIWDWVLCIYGVTTDVITAEIVAEHLSVTDKDCLCWCWMHLLLVRMRMAKALDGCVVRLCERSCPRHAVFAIPVMWV